MLKLNCFATLRFAAAAFALTCLSLAISTESSSARQVGTAVVNGRIIIIESDGTWKYKDESASGSGNCDTLEHIKICLGASGWSKANLPGDFIGSYTSDSGKYFLGIVYEPNGSNEGYTYDFLQKAIIENAAGASNTTAEDIPILDSTKKAPELEGFRSVTYSPTINGAPFMFHNIFKIYDDRAVQFAFWGLGRTYTDEFRKEVEQFTKNVSFSKK